MTAPQFNNPLCQTCGFQAVHKSKFCRRHIAENKRRAALEKYHAKKRAASPFKRKHIKDPALPARGVCLQCKDLAWSLNAIYCLPCLNVRKDKTRQALVDIRNANHGMIICPGCKLKMNAFNKSGAPRVFHGPACMLKHRQMTMARTDGNTPANVKRSKQDRRRDNMARDAVLVGESDRVPVYRVERGTSWSDLEVDMA